MNGLVGKLDMLIIRAGYALKNAVRSFVRDEKGDTNFISIAIILVVVIVIAGVIITFWDDLKPVLENKTQDIISKLTGL